MKKFLIRIVSFVGIPIVVLLVVYVITDPFKTLRPFSLQYFDETNRDYLSSELFMRNNPNYHYNSFIFGSSRCNGFNTYHWKHYLPDDSRQYLFQAWGETLTGIEQKIEYLDKNGNDIDNAIVLLDIPGSFAAEQLPKSVVSLKHYKFSGQSVMAFQAHLFYGFIQKPSKWVSSIKGTFSSTIHAFPVDTITNDWGIFQDVDIDCQPQKDSLSNLTEKTRAIFLKQIGDANYTENDLKESNCLINSEFEKQLHRIKEIFDKHDTDYRIVISPAYCYTHPSINREDLKVLQRIFGEAKVFDYSGKNEITTDCYNFTDRNHFGQSVGWQIIEDTYNKSILSDNK